MALSVAEEIEMLELEIQIEEEELAIAEMEGIEAPSFSQELPQGFDVGAVTQAPATPFEEEQQRFQQEIAPQQQAARQADVQAAEERKGRRELAELDPKTGQTLPGQGETFLERMQNIAFTTDVTEDPEAGAGSAALGLSGIVPRTFGAATMQGDIAQESTKLLKPFIEDLNEWAGSREAQNMSADDMITNLNEAVRKSVLSGEVSAEDIKGMTDQIGKLEEQKNSGALTTALDIVGNISLETGSDPGFLLSAYKIMRNAISGGLKAFKTGAKLADDVIGATSDKMAKLGIRNNDMLKFIEDQPGIGVRQKLSNIKKRQAGETTPSGEIQATSIERMFDESTLNNLIKNADEIEQELKALKEAKPEALRNVEAKAKGRTEAVTEAQKGEEFGIEAQAGLETIEAQKAGEKLKGAIREGAEKDIKAVATDVEPSEVVGEFTNGGKFSGRGINEAFENAEELAASGKIDQATRKSLIGEMIASVEGDVDRIVDYDKFVNSIWGIRKDAPLSDYKRLMKNNDIDPAYAESFRRIKQGNANDIIAAKRQFNKVLAKEGTALDDTMKRAADNFKTEADKVVKSTLGEDGYAKLLSLQKAGGKFSSAQKDLLGVMGISRKEAEIIDPIKLNDGIKKLDKFIDDAAAKYAKSGSFQDLEEGARFSEWKKHFGIEAKKEVINRAKKLDIAQEAVVAEKGIEQVTKEAVGKIVVDAKKAKKALSESSGSAKAKIAEYAKQSKAQLQKGFTRRAAEINRALKEAQAATKGAGSVKSVAEDFRKQVKYFANEGGFSKATKSFEDFEKKYGKKLADMVEDQAILSTFDINSKGKIANFDKLVNSFQGIRQVPAQAARAAIFTEGVINNLYRKIQPFDKRLNKFIEKTKKGNRELAKQLNRMEKRGKVDEFDKLEIFDLLMEKQPLITLDDLVSEFKFIDVRDFYDVGALQGIVNGTVKGHTNREKKAAKRLLARMNKGN